MRRTRHKGQCGHQTHCFQHTFHFLSIRGDRPLCRRSLPIRCKESANSYLPFLKVHLSSFPLQRYNNFPTKQISNGKYMQNKRYSSPHRYNAAIFRTRCNREIEPDRTGCGRIFSLRRIIYFYPKYPLIYLTDAPKTTASIGGGTVRTSASGTPPRSGACLPASHNASNRRLETSSG